MVYTLENENLKIEVNSYGAELSSVTGKKNGLSYMWDAGDAWKRHSPVLFPIVGGLNNKSYRCNGKEYHMNQHGFARDMEFSLCESTESSLSFVLEETSETLAAYPYKFLLKITYTLLDSAITVAWEVVNTNDGSMYFSIGGHPAFTCPLKDAKQTDCYLHFDENGTIDYNLLNENGLCLPEIHKLKTENGYVKITESFFDKDALVMYNNRTRSVSLAGSDKKDYLKVTFDAPVYGIWSAKGKHAPFVCIEPWFGRCDAHDFTGSLEEREFGNTLEKGERFKAQYTVEVIQ